MGRLWGKKSIKLCPTGICIFNFIKLLNLKRIIAKGEIMKTFFGFALAASMFDGDGNISFKQLDAESATKAIESAKADGSLAICLNPSHQATITAMGHRYGIEVPIPEVAPQVKLAAGDSLMVMGVRGLPRLDATRHEYTEEEIAKATFQFSVFTRTE